MGMLMHVYVWSRHDIGFALTRLGRYVQAPNPASFEGLLCTVRYIATHMNRPIMYPRASVDGYHSLHVDFDQQCFGKALLTIVDHGFYCLHFSQL